MISQDEKLERNKKDGILSREFIFDKEKADFPKEI